MDLERKNLLDSDAVSTDKTTGTQKNLLNRMSETKTNEKKEFSDLPERALMAEKEEGFLSSVYKPELKEPNKTVASMAMNPTQGTARYLYADDTKESKGVSNPQQNFIDQRFNKLYKHEDAFSTKPKVRNSLEYQNQFNTQYNLKRKNILDSQSRQNLNQTFHQYKKNQAIYERVKPNLIKFEEGPYAPVLHAYKDTENYITAGTGKNVDNPEIFKTIEWLDENGKKLTFDEALAERQRLEQAVPGKTANFYKDKSRLRISLETRDQLLKEHVLNDLKELKSKFPDFDELPPSAQDVLIDLQFNLGGKRFNPQIWHKLFSALKKKDWKEASEQVKRKNINNERNEWARKRMLEF